jgi:dihydroneopterin aldolase
MSTVTRSRIAITLAGMRFHVRVGVLPHERELAQPLELDLTVRLAPGHAEVLDYRTLYALTCEVMERGPLEYLEVIGGEIASRCLALPAVASVRVAVRKPHVSLGGPLAHAEVVVEQDRE